MTHRKNSRASSKIGFLIGAHLSLVENTRDGGSEHILPTRKPAKVKPLTRMPQRPLRQVPDRSLTPPPCSYLLQQGAVVAGLVLDLRMDDGQRLAVVGPVAERHQLQLQLLHLRREGIAHQHAVRHLHLQGEAR